MDTQAYERALARANAEGVTVVGDSVSPTGRKAWSVFNPKNGLDGWYTVRQEPGASIYTCNCRATVLCKHIAKVIETSARPQPGPRQTVGMLRADRMQVSSLWL